METVNGLLWKLNITLLSFGSVAGTRQVVIKKEHN